ncbi:MAG: RIP metalloprotease RseP [Acidobacteriota bacterium]
MFSTLLISVPAFLLALGAIVFVHEFGHFAVAKLFGMRVHTFSLGFGKRLVGFDFRGTDVRISAIPLGGYVRVGGELPEERTGASDDFASKPRWQRILFYLAGPAMNAVLSVALLTAVFMVGIEMQAFQGIPAVIGAIEEDSAATEADLRVGDRIVAIDGEPVALWNEVSFALITAAERPVALGIERDGARIERVITPRKVPRYELGEAGVYPRIVVRITQVMPDGPAEAAGFRPGDAIRRVDGAEIGDALTFVERIEAATGETVRVEIERDGGGVETLAVVPAIDPEDGKGRIGVGLGAWRKLPLGEALVESVRYNIDIVVKSTQVLGKLFSRELAPQAALSGPIEIAAWSGRAARRGAKHMVFTIAFLSISIGFMNLLPIPILDGGQITILLIESVLRRDLSMVLKERIAQAGFMALMMLMAVVLFFDLAKNLPVGTP